MGWKRDKKLQDKEKQASGAKQENRERTLTVCSSVRREGSKGNLHSCENHQVKRNCPTSS